MFPDARLAERAIEKYRADTLETRCDELERAQEAFSEMRIEACCQLAAVRREKEALETALGRCEKEVAHSRNEREAAQQRESALDVLCKQLQEGRFADARALATVQEALSVCQVEPTPTPSLS